jgi:hypothetical protein
LRKVRETAIVVDVQVSEHDCLDVAGADAEAPQLRPKLLLGLDVETNAELKIRMPARQRLQTRIGAGVDDNRAFGVFDRPGIDRRPVGPFRRQQRLQLPP